MKQKNILSKEAYAEKVKVLGKKINDDFIQLGAELIKDKDFSISKLADKIKNNEINVSDQNIIDFLYDLTEKKIDIDNPKYKKN